jgi:hypothetical protein
MKHTIEKLKEKLTIIIDNKPISYTGYAFIDESGHCIIIVYGESRRDDMSKYLNSDSDPLGLKYKIIDLLPSSKG